MLKLMPGDDGRRPHTTAGQRVARKYRKAAQRRLRRKEYTKLRAMVPSVAARDKVSKVTVIEEAIKYIEELHSALAMRLKSNGEWVGHVTLFKVALFDDIKIFLKTKAIT